MKIITDNDKIQSLIILCFSSIGYDHSVWLPLVKMITFLISLLTQHMYSMGDKDVTNERMSHELVRTLLHIEKPP